jgi:hypothetical protein
VDAVPWGFRAIVVRAKLFVISSKYGDFVGLDVALEAISRSRRRTGSKRANDPVP